MSTVSAPLMTALLFGPLLLGLFQHLRLEPIARLWYSTLKKSPYRPPSFVFPVAWTWSYLSIGYASYLVYRADSESAVISVALSVPLYLVHIGLQNAWIYFFMTCRKVSWGMNIMLALVVTASWLLVSVYCIDHFAAALCLPYFCWLLELTYLNMFMERNNADSLSKEEIIRAHGKRYEMCTDGIVPVLELKRD